MTTLMVLPDDDLVERLNKLFLTLTQDEIKVIAEELVSKSSWPSPYNSSLWSPKAWLQTGVFGTVVSLERLVMAFNGNVRCVFWDGSSLRVYLP